MGIYDVTVEIEPVDWKVEQNKLTKTWSRNNWPAEQHWEKNFRTMLGGGINLSFFLPSVN